MDAIEDRETTSLDLCAEMGGVGHQRLAEFGSILDDVERGHGGGGDRRWKRIRKEIGSRALAEDIDDLFAAAGKSSGGAAEGFAEGAGDDIDPVSDAEVFGCATSSRCP